MENPFQSIMQALLRIESQQANIANQLAAQKEAGSASAIDLHKWEPISAAEEELGLSRQTIYQNVAKIPHAKRNGRLYFNRQQLREYVAQGQPAAA